MILVDNKYFGHALHNARSTLALNKTNVATRLGISLNVLKRYETGKEVMSQEFLEKLLRNGLILIMK